MCVTERLHFHFSLSCIGEGNGNPLQCSSLENPRDGVTQSRTRLKWLSSSSSSSNACVCVCVCLCVCVCVCVCVHAWKSTRLLCLWNFPDKNTGVCCHFLLQGIFPSQGLNPRLLQLQHWQADSLPLSHKGSPLDVIFGKGLFNSFGYHKEDNT